MNLASHYLNTPIEILRGGASLAYSVLPEMRTTIGFLEASLTIMATDIQSLLTETQTRSASTSHTYNKLDKLSIPHLLKRPGVWLPITSTTILMLIFQAILLTASKLQYNPYRIGILVSILAFLSAMLIAAYYARARMKQLGQKVSDELRAEKEIAANRIHFIQHAHTTLNKDMDSIRTIANSLIATEKVGPFMNGLKMAEGVLYKLNMIEKFSSLSARPSPLDATIALNNQIPKYKELAEIKGITVSTHIDPAIKLALEPIALQQLCDSLVDNAIKFTKNGGKISVNLLRKGKYSHLIVRDTGIGIQPEKISQLMAPFSRATDVLQYDFEGIGLSLYINKLIAVQSRGDISIKSTINKGTTVIVKLPNS